MQIYAITSPFFFISSLNSSFQVGFLKFKLGSLYSAFLCLFASQSLSSLSVSFSSFPPLTSSCFSSFVPASWTNTPRESGWRCRRERERREGGNRWTEKVCNKVPPCVEHGHLSWGWKLKKRLVNLYSWSPWDTGKNTAQQNTSRNVGTVRTHTCAHACMNGPCSTGSRIQNQ